MPRVRTRFSTRRINETGGKGKSGKMDEGQKNSIDKVASSLFNSSWASAMLKQ